MLSKEEVTEKRAYNTELPELKLTNKPMQSSLTANSNIILETHRVIQD